MSYSLTEKKCNFCGSTEFVSIEVEPSFLINIKWKITIDGNFMLIQTLCPRCEMPMNVKTEYKQYFSPDMDIGTLKTTFLVCTWNGCRDAALKIPHIIEYEAFLPPR